MTVTNIHVTGVGGQGIGLLGEVIIRAADRAGLAVRGVDTHGMAQRGGIVTSQIRVGDGAHSPLIRTGDADLVVALERNEALRALDSHLKDGGVLVYYDAVWAPLDVRLGRARPVTPDHIQAACRQRRIREYRVFLESLEDARMQNVVLLATLARENLIPAVRPVHYRTALGELLVGAVREENLRLFAEQLARTVPGDRRRPNG